MELCLDAAQAGHFARLALHCVTREYPNKIAHVLTSAADVRAPRHLTPAFYGCFDWHSAVHGHWLLARLARLFAEEPFAAEARAVLETNISDVTILGEIRYLSAPGRVGFERPYGLAWLLALSTELERLDFRLGETVRPLADLAYEHLYQCLLKLPFPDRSGQHANTAFALGLIHDSRYGQAMKWEFAERFYGADSNAPIGFEPSGEDFLSPCLAEADLMRRLMPRGEFANWLARFFPEVPQLKPLFSPDRSDGKLTHLDGLNLSRAWMLQGIARAVSSDNLSCALESMAGEHAEAGLAAVTGDHYEGAHWLGTFAVYLLTRGL